MQAGRIRFHRACFMVVLLGFSGSPESRTQHYSVISRVRATGPRLPHANVVVSMSGWQESNLLARAPKARGPPMPHIPSLFPTRAPLRSAVSSSCGNRTRLSALKGQYPQTDRRTSHLSAHLPRSRKHGWRAFFTQWTGRCSNPRLRLFRPPLDHLSYQSNKKSPMSL